MKLFFKYTTLLLVLMSKLIIAALHFVVDVVITPTPEEDDTELDGVYENITPVEYTYHEDLDGNGQYVAKM